PSTPPAPPHHTAHRPRPPALLLATPAPPVLTSEWGRFPPVPAGRRGRFQVVGPRDPLRVVRRGRLAAEASPVRVGPRPGCCGRGVRLPRGRIRRLPRRERRGAGRGGSWRGRRWPRPCWWPQGSSW